MNVDQLIVYHYAWIKNKARQFYYDGEDAEDLASETILKCLLNDRKFECGRDFKPWLLAIMANTFKTQYRRRMCVPMYGSDKSDIAVSDMYSDQLASVHSIIATLRRCCRVSVTIECVSLYAKGYTYKEIAERKGISIGTVRSRISLGRALLRCALSHDNF